MRTTIIALLLIMSSNLFASDGNFELHLGLNTYHFDREPNDEGCLNETHNLVGFRYGYIIGGYYENSHCNDAYYFGGSYPLGGGWDFEGVLVSGYPEYMQQVGDLAILAAPTYTWTANGIGVRFLVAPTQLLGAGLVIKF